MTQDARFDLPLTRDERFFLAAGLNEWRGPAHCTDEMAVAMGFGSVQDLFAQIPRLIDAVHGHQLPTRDEWFRILLATEIVFASDVVGSGSDWSAGVGLSDEDSLHLLRSVQDKVFAGRPIG